MIRRVRTSVTKSVVVNEDSKVSHVILKGRYTRINKTRYKVSTGSFSTSLW